MKRLIQLLVLLYCSSDIHDFFIFYYYLNQCSDKDILCDFNESSRRREVKQNETANTNVQVDDEVTLRVISSIQHYSNKQGTR